MNPQSRSASLQARAIRSRRLLLIGMLMVLGFLTSRAASTNFAALLSGSAGRSGTATWPATLREGESVALQWRADGHVPRVVLDVEVTGDAVLVRGDARIPARDVIALRGAALCGETAPVTVCHVMLPAGDTTASIVAWRGSAVIHGVKLRTVRLVAASSARGPRLSLVILLVVGSLPLAWLLYGRRALSEWLLTGIGLTCVTLLHPVFGASLLGLLLLLFWLGARQRDTSNRGRLLAAGLVLTFALLLAFKYGAPVLATVFAAPGLFPAVLALGVSYFVIRIIDTQLRWHRGELREVSLREYLAFMLFPPTIPAGPLETLDHFRQCRADSISRGDVTAGLTRIALGIVKKVLIADLFLSRLLWRGAPSLFERVVSNPAAASSEDVFALLFTSFLYAYIDFSAYSDIAIGLARLFGYRIVENFDWPILATDLRDFWRRWHMSLSSWCFRNVYVPLSITTRSSALPVLAVMLLVGVWHAVSATWGAWAIHHFAGLVVLGYLHKQKRMLNLRWPLVQRALSTVATIAFVTAGHAFVLVHDFRTAAQLYARWWRALIPFP